MGAKLQRDPLPVALHCSATKRIGVRRRSGCCNVLDRKLPHRAAGALLSWKMGKEDHAMLTGTCHCGAAHWTLKGDPGPITACNCTLCRRYGVLWAYDYVDGRIRIVGPVKSYTRVGKADPALEILFCPTCGCVLAWRGLRRDDQGRRRIAVNVRLAEPDAVADLPIDHFDGLDSFEDLPRDGRCVRDLWF